MIRLRSKRSFLAGLLNGKRTFVGSAWVVFDVTRRRNNICRGCFSHCVQPRSLPPGNQRIQGAPLSLARKLSRELVQAGTSEVVLLGEGEPLLHPQYYEIVSAFKGAGLKTQPRISLMQDTSKPAFLLLLPDRVILCLSQRTCRKQFKF
jgi:MoaA/NifB/PqqE/SkfB family radical SAM enzyme